MSSSGLTLSGPDGSNIHASEVTFGGIADRNGESSTRAGSRSSGPGSERNTPSRGKERMDAGINISGRLRRVEDKVKRRSVQGGGFLLQPPLESSPRSRASPEKLRTLDGGGDWDDSRHASFRPSSEASSRSSRLSWQPSKHPSSAVDDNDRHHSRSELQNQAIDPAQLVQMALSLSNSRRRQASSSMRLSTREENGQRLVPPSVPHALLSGAIGINQIREGTPSKPGPSTEDRRSTDADLHDVNDEDNIVYTFSAATYMRAERARRYFEQADEYRRLLQYLPPLTPKNNRAHSVANANDDASRDSAQGSIQSSEIRTLDGRVGRQYNPLQALRNRHVRAQKAMSLPGADAWSNRERTKAWVDRVAETTRDSQLGEQSDRLDLPPLTAQQITDATLAEGLNKGRLRAGTVTTHHALTDLYWTIEPSELLADAYWTEQKDNRQHIENRHGIALFTSPTPRDDKDEPSIFNEGSDKGSNHDRSPILPVNFEDFSPRKRKLVLPLKGAISKRHRRLLSRASSISSTESNDTAAGRRERQLSDVNTGPLERYMQARIAKEERASQEEPVATPAEVSDRWQLMHRRGTLSLHRDAVSRSSNRASLEVPRDLHRRPMSADDRLELIADNTASSADESEYGSAYASDSVSRWPSIGMALSSTERTDGTSSNKRTRSKLGIFSVHHKDQNRSAHKDFAPNSNGAVVGASTLTDEHQPRRASFESARSDISRHHRASSTQLNSLTRSDTNATGTASFFTARDSGTAVGRFFKGGRIGDLVRGEGSRHKHRQRSNDESMTDVDPDVFYDSGAEGSVSAVGQGTKSKNADDSDGSQRTSHDQYRRHKKYHSVDLPAFTSTNRNRRPTTESQSSTAGEQTWRTDDLQQSKTRLDRPAPPRIIFPNGLNSSTNELTRQLSFVSEKGDDEENSIQRSATNTSTGTRGPRAGQRQWSISDQGMILRDNTRITKRDIARVEALLLSSGIKATEILRKANSPREPPNQLLVKAVDTAKVQFPRTTRKEDDITAMRLLSDVIDSRAKAHEKALTEFRSHTASDLASRIDSLHAIVADNLSTLVRDMSDAADAFVVELTTRQPQQTKRVDEAIDAILRQRRSQFRLLRKIGWGSLEYLLLTVMWVIWFCVVILNLGRRAIVWIFTLVRWLFTL